MASPDQNKSSSAHEIAPDKMKDTRGVGAGSDKKESGKGGVEALIQQVLDGSLPLDEAVAMNPAIVPIMQAKFGNKVVGDIALKQGKGGAEGKEAKKGPATSKATPDKGAADKGGDAKAGVGVVGKMALGAGAGALLSKAGVLGGKDDKGKDDKGSDGKDDKVDSKAQGKDDKGAASKGANEVKSEGKTEGKDAGKSETPADKDAKDVKEVKAGQDPGKKVDEAIKKEADQKPVVADKVADKKDSAKDDKQVDKKPGDDPKKATADQKNDDALKKTTDAKDAVKGDGQKESGGAKNTANAVLDKAKDVSANKDDGKQLGGKLADAGKDKEKAKDEGSKKESKGDAKGESKEGKKAADGKVDAKESKDAKKGSDGKDPGAAKDGKADAKADEKKGGKEGQDEVKSDDKANPAAKDAVKAKGDADKAPDPGAGGKDDGGGGAGAKEEAKAPDGAGGKEGAGPGGDGGAGATVGPAPTGPAPTPGGAGGAVKEKSLDEYIKAHPDAAAADRVQNLKFQNDKVGRDANELKGNVEPAPDKSWLDAVSPRQELFALKKAVMGPNKWTGQDKALDFMTRLNGALDSIGGAAGKIGLAATIGGAILTFLVPPVGAFLLAVGRIANAVQLACSALRIVTSIVTTIMLAVKAAKEKDPIKRLEMMQEMKANVQSGVMAGIDVIMSKIGGKAKGAAGASGSKAMGAAKAAWKEGMKAGGLKGVVKGAAGFVKEGVKAFGQGMKQSFKDGVSGIKGQLAMAKQLGVGGTIKAIGKGIGSGIKGALTETFVKPVTDMRAAVKSCMNFRQNWRDFRSMITANGGGFSGYRSTLGQINFPNYGGANWKEKAKSVFKDVTDTSAGGYASQVMAGIEGKEAKNTYKKDADGKDVMSADGKTKVLDTSDPKKNQSAGSVLAAEQKEKLAKLEAALNGSDLDKRKALNDDKDNSGALAAELDSRGHAYSAHKNSIGTQDSGTAYSVQGADPGIGPRQLHTESNLDFRLKAEIAKTKSSFNVIKPASVGGMGMDVAKVGYRAAKGDATLGDIAKTVVGHAGPVGEKASDFMVNQTSQKEKAKEKKGLFAEAAEKNSERTKAAVGEVPGMLKDGSWANLTANKVNAATSPAMKVVADRERALAESMVQSGPKTASAPTPTVASSKETAVKSEPPPPPPPPAPPEGTTVPDPALLTQIASERASIAKIKADVKADIKASEGIKAQAIGADQTMVKYATGLDTQAGELGKEKADAAKDVSEVSASKEKLTKGGADLAANKDKAKAQEGVTKDQASKGSSVANPQVDEAKKKAEERKKSAEEKAAWDRDYASSGFLRRRYLDAKKLIGGVFSWIAKAAQWVWNNIIKIAIEAVKKAIAKVIGFITDLMMAGILKLVKCFLSEEEGARLDSTMAQMKELEAKQAQKATEETAEKNKEAKMKLSGAQQAAKAKIDHAQGNIKTGTDLLGQLDANDSALKTEEGDVKSKNEAFKAQYTPYFTWAAEQDKKGPAKEKDGKDGAQTKDPAKGDSKDSGAADKAGAGTKTSSANAGKDEGKQEHPADKKLDPQVSSAIAMAVTVLIADSKQSTSDVAKASGLQSGKVTRVADNVVQANIADLKAAAAKSLAQGQQGDAGSYMQDETMRGQSIKTAAGNVHSKIVGSHANAEGERQARLQQLLGVANGLSGQPLAQALSTADQLIKQMGKEAASIDAARKSAMEELAQGYQKSVAG